MVGRIRRNALFARAEDGKTRDSLRLMAAHPEPGSRCARHIGRAKIHTPRPLQQITGSGRHIPKLHRRAAQIASERTFVIFTDEWGGRLDPSCGRPRQSLGRHREALRSCRAATVDIHQRLRLLDIQLHQVDQGCAAAD